MIIKHIPLNSHNIIGFLQLEIPEIFKAIDGLLSEISGYFKISKKLSCTLDFLRLAEKSAQIFTHISFLISRYWRYFFWHIYHFTQKENPYWKSTGIFHPYRAWTNRTIKARISVLVVWQSRGKYVLHL